MAEVVGITAAIASLLKAIASTGSLIHGITRAPHEATHIRNQLEAAEAILVSLKASIQATHQSQEFLSIWNQSFRKVLQNMDVTIGQMNTQLGGKSNSGGARLSFFGRIKWPFEREEALDLQQQMQGYMQMLSIVHTAFLQGTAQGAQSSAQDVDDILTSVGTYPFSSPAENVPVAPQGDVYGYQYSDRQSLYSFDDNTIVASDSISQIGTPSKHNNLPSRFRLQDIPTRDKWFYYITCPISLRQKRPKRDVKLGPGNLHFAVTYSPDRLWVVFHPLGVDIHESRWYLTLKDSKTNLRSIGEQKARFNFPNCVVEPVGYYSDGRRGGYSLEEPEDEIYRLNTPQDLTRLFNFCLSNLQPDVKKTLWNSLQSEEELSIDIMYSDKAIFSAIEETLVGAISRLADAESKAEAAIEREKQQEQERKAAKAALKSSARMA